MIFTGLYHDVRFEFKVYVNGQGSLNRKTGQNLVWHKPVTPPDMLRDAIDEVIRLLKALMELGMWQRRKASPKIMTELLLKEGGRE
jgi:hypothetical protein